MDGRKNNGGHSTKGFAGRKPKSEEIKLVERLSPLEDAALDALKKGVESGELKWINCILTTILVNQKKQKTLQSTKIYRCLLRTWTNLTPTLQPICRLKKLLHLKSYNSYKAGYE